MSAVVEAEADGVVPLGDAVGDAVVDDEGDADGEAVVDWVAVPLDAGAEVVGVAELAGEVDVDPLVLVGLGLVEEPVGLGDFDGLGEPVGVDVGSHCLAEVPLTADV